MPSSSGSVSKVTSDIFVGRDEQLQVFRQFIAFKSNAHVLNIHSRGDGGIGKTQLLIQMQKHCEAVAENILFNKEFIDFYHAESHSPIGIMHQIAKNMGIQYFSAFDALVEQYRKTEDPSERQVISSQLEKAFKNDYANFSNTMKDKIIVLFFDTYEVIQGEVKDVDGQKKAESTELSHWIETKLFLLLLKNQNTRILVSGRYPVQEIEHIQSIVEVIDLGHLSFEEAVEFWKKCCGLEPESELCQLIQKFEVDSEAHIDTLYNLTDGRPIFLALFADWVNYPRKKILSPKELLNQTRQEFEKFLIEQISSLVKPEDIAVTLMAIAYHRMTPELFHALEPDDYSIDKCRDILLKKLKSLSFIKFKKEDTVILHDEMRRLIVELWWNSHDRGRDLRKEIAANIVAYYENELLKADNLTEEDRETYTSELLEYAVFADLKDGIERFRFEFSTALEDGRHDYYKLLLRELERLYRENPEEFGFPYSLEIDLARIQYNIHTNADYEQSVKMTEALLEQYQAKQWGDSDLPGHILFSRGLAKLWMGELKDAIESFENALQIFYHTGEHDWLYQTYNLIGYAYYRQGQFSEATRFLEQSREGFYRALMQQKEPMGRKQRQQLQGLQTALGNLAGVDSYTGKFEQAVRKTEVILNIVRNLPYNSFEIARTRTSCGHAALYAGHAIDARHHFRVAKELLQTISRNRLLIGRINTELGFLEYRVNELAYLLEYYRAEEIEQIITKSQFIPSTNIVKARELIEEAISVLEEEPAIKKELADAYYSLGELYMVTPSKDHWKQAEEAFLKSLKWSEESQFRYRVIDTIESLVTLYYFWNRASGISPTIEQETCEKMALYRQKLEDSPDFRDKPYPELFAKYAITLGDSKFDEALEILNTSHREHPDLSMGALKSAFTHYISAAELLEEFNERHYYLVLQVFYNRLKTLIKQVQKKKAIVKQLDELRSIWESKSKRFKDIYQAVCLSLQPDEKKLQDLEDHIQKTLEKGNFGWSALLNVCLIGIYQELRASNKEKEDYHEKFILQLNAQSRLYRILGDVYQAEQSIETAREALEAVVNLDLKNALEGYIDSCEGTLKYRRGEYSKPLEFYLQDQLSDARKNKFDQQFPQAREEALQLLCAGEEKLVTTLKHWNAILQESKNAAKKALLQKRVQSYLQKLGETRFRLGELQMLNEEFDDLNDQKGALTYLRQAIKDCENSKSYYYYYYALQSYVNAVYFADRYDEPEYRKTCMEYESQLEENQQETQASIMGRLRITQGDIIFSRCFQRQEDQATGEYTYLPCEDNIDHQTLKTMLRYYVEACNFMKSIANLQFDDALRTLQRRIELIGDKDTLQFIQHNLRTIWEFQPHLRKQDADEELIDQFARIREIIVKS